MSDDSDGVEFEEEWEEVGQHLKQEADAGKRTASGDIVVVLQQDADPRKRKRRRTATEWDKQYAELVHRSHALCLLAAGALHDVAASSLEVQAAMLSLLDQPLWVHATAGVKAATAAAKQESLGWLRALVTWFRTSFTPTPPADAGLAVDDTAQPQPIAAVLAGCIRSAGGTPEQLTALQAALLRGLGLPVRTVWALEVASRKACADDDAGEVPVASKALSALRSASGRRRGRSAAKAAVELAELGGGAPRGGGAASCAALDAHAPAPKRHKRDPQAGGGGGGTAAADGLPQRSWSAGATSAAAGASPGPGAAAGSGAAGAGAAEDASASASAAARRGNQELEAQLALALMTSQLEAELRPAGRQRASPRAAADRPAGPASGTAAPRIPRPLARPASGGSPAKRPARDAAAAGNGSCEPAVGRVVARGAGAQPRCWVEAYIGDDARGRWVPADGVAGLVDRPGAVEAEVKRRRPLVYVVAFQGGAPKDVTRRYAAKYADTVKLRDEDWWQGTMSQLRDTSAHLPATVRASATATAAAAAPPPAAHAARQGQQAAGGAGAGSARRAVADAAAASLAAAAGAQESAAALRAAREDAELRAKVAVQNSGLPTTMAGFKGHPLYTLERHITKYQALCPGAKPLGLHRGVPYYSSQDVHELHTRERWRREGRDVRAEEVDAPAKRVKKRAVGGGGGGTRKGSDRGFDDCEHDGTACAAQQDAADAPGTADESALASDATTLYGFWQTMAWEPPAAAGGKVPTNERGNVEVPPLARVMPSGTVHLRYPGLGPLCRQLGVHFAPALVGFEPQAGRMVPRIEGVVVCKEFEQVVAAAYQEREADRTARADRKRWRDAEVAWTELLKAMWMRLQLQRRYSGGVDPSAGGVPSSSSGGQAAAGEPRGKGGGAAKAALERAAKDGAKGRAKPSLAGALRGNAAVAVAVGVGCVAAGAEATAGVAVAAGAGREEAHPPAAEQAAEAPPPQPVPDGVDMEEF